jgi:hypothetical protein
VADSHKCTCKNEEFKYEKTVNRFPKIKEAFMIKLKMIFVDYYFLSHQTLRNAENKQLPLEFGNVRLPLSDFNEQDSSQIQWDSDCTSQKLVRLARFAWNLA